MTKTTNLDLYTWVKTDGVDVGQISSNFQTLDTVCHRADNLVLLGSAQLSADAAQISAALSGWRPEQFHRLIFRFAGKVSSGGSGSGVNVSVTGADGNAYAVRMGQCSHSDSRDYQLSAHGEALLVDGTLWDVDYSYIMGLGTNLSSSARSGGRLTVSGAPAAVAISLTAESGESQPVLRSGATLSVYGAV